MRKGKLRRNRLDERQEQKMLQIEHNGCWIAFWGLAISLFVGYCLGLEWRNLVGEWIVFMGLSLYIVIAGETRLPGNLFRLEASSPCPISVLRSSV